LTFDFKGKAVQIARPFYLTLVAQARQMVLHSQFQDFVLFLYVHMAASDGTIHSGEELVILSKMTNLFPQESDLKKKLNQAVAEYRALDPSLVTSVIRESFGYFNQVTFAEKYKVYSDMYDIVNADGKVEESERHALTALKQIIDMDEEMRHSQDH
jgi:uncharacterized tellurite resistance protein B-like protein